MPSTAPHARATSGPPVSAWVNWAGNQRASASAVVRPRTLDEVVAAVGAAAAAGGRIKAVGSGHSFTDIAVTRQHRLELTGMAGLVAVDRPARRVTVGAGTTLRQLNEILHSHGLALPNLGDIDGQTIAGAVSTGTHGTGATFGSLSTFVDGLTLVTGTGDVMRCSADAHPDVFAAARVGLGALGVLTEVSLHCEEAFFLRADERPAALADVLAALPEHLGDNDHVEFYWFPYTDRVQLKRNNRVPRNDRPLTPLRRWLGNDFLPNTVYGAACRLGRALPQVVPTISSVSARVLPTRTYTGRSDQVFCTSRRVRFTEMEYAVPRAALPEALAALRRVIDGLSARVQFPVEVRFTAADDIWLSHGYGRESAYLAVHQYVGAPYERYFRAFEQECVRLGGRPHWGKLHYRDAASLRPAYPRFDDFLAVRDRLDPGRVFANAYTERVLGP